MKPHYNPTSAYHAGRQDGVFVGVATTLFIVALIVGAIAFTGCATTGTINIPAPPPIELETAP